MIQTLFYFGCLGSAGHCLYQRFEKRIISVHYPPKEFSERFTSNGSRLDGLFCPPPSWPSQVWMASSVGEWLIASWWDFSVDSRPGSHSTFVGSGFSTHEGLLACAEMEFAEVFARQPKIRKGVFTPNL